MRAVFIPKLDQRPCITEHRVQFWQRYVGDFQVYLWSFTGFSVIHIPALTVWIGTDHSKIRAGSQVFMCDTGRNNNDISTPDLKFGPFWAAQLDPHIAAVDAKNFMGSAVIMVINENAVAPRTSPILFFPHALAQR